MTELFNPLDKSQDISFQVLPEGDYLCRGKNSILKDTKKGDGRYLQLNLEIVEGDFAGELITDRFNLDNPNQLAVRIAKSALYKYCEAIGVVEQFNPLAHIVPELYGKLVWVSVSIQKAPAGSSYGDSQKIKGYKPYSKAKKQDVAASNITIEDDEIPY